jgi:hypothetical protein
LEQHRRGIYEGLHIALMCVIIETRALWSHTYPTAWRCSMGLLCCKVLGHLCVLGLAALELLKALFCCEANQATSWSGFTACGCSHPFWLCPPFAVVGLCPAGCWRIRETFCLSLCGGTLQLWLSLHCVGLGFLFEGRQLTLVGWCLPSLFSIFQIPRRRLWVQPTSEKTSCPAFGGHSFVTEDR